MTVTASLPRYAVYDSSGKLNPAQSAQALGKAYDLPPPGGGPATGGLQRATSVSNIASDAATWNTHMAVGNVHDLIDGLAAGRVHHRRQTDTSYTSWAGAGSVCCPST